MDVDSALVPPRVTPAPAHRPTTTPQRLRTVQSAREAARRSGLPVPALVHTPDGHGFCTLPDGTLVELEAHVDWDTPMKTFPYLRKGFAALARLHDVLRTVRYDEPVASPPHATYLDPDAAVEGVRRGAARMRGWKGDPSFATLADDVQRHCEAVADKEARLRDDRVRQLVHGDFWDGNVVFRDGRLAGLLDVDFLGERDRVEELALTLWFHLLEPGNRPPGEQQVQQVRGNPPGSPEAGCPCWTSRAPAPRPPTWPRVCPRPRRSSPTCRDGPAR